METMDRRGRGPDGRRGPCRDRGVLPRHYHALVRPARVRGAGRYEAASAVDEAMADLPRRWRQVDNPWAYAQKAVLRNFLKTRKRDGDRLRRTIAGGQVTPEAGAPARGGPPTNRGSRTGSPPRRRPTCPQDCPADRHPRPDRRTSPDPPRARTVTTHFPGRPAQQTSKLSRRGRVLPRRSCPAPPLAAQVPRRLPGV
jgi:hypothetical protein